MISAFSFIIIGGALLHYACKSCDRRIEETSSPRARPTPMVVMMVHSASRSGRSSNGFPHNTRRYDALPFTICSRTSIGSSTTSPVSSPVSQNGTICEELEALSGGPPSYEIVLRHPDAFAQMLQSAENIVPPPPSYNRCISQQWRKVLIWSIIIIVLALVTLPWIPLVGGWWQSFFIPFSCVSL